MPRPDLPGQLLLSVVNRTLCPFVGAGFSYSFGYPSWKEFLSSIAQDDNVQFQETDEIGKQNPLEMAEILRGEFAHWMSDGE